MTDTSDYTGTPTVPDSTLNFKQPKFRFDRFLLDRPDSYQSIRVTVGWTGPTDKDPALDPSNGAMIPEVAEPQEVQNVADLTSYSLRPTISSDPNAGPNDTIRTLSGKPIRYTLTVETRRSAGDGYRTPIKAIPFDIDAAGPEEPEFTDITELDGIRAFVPTVTDTARAAIRTEARAEVDEYLTANPPTANPDAATLAVNGGTNTTATTLNAALAEHGDNIAAAATAITDLENNATGSPTAWPQWNNTDTYPANSIVQIGPTIYIAINENTGSAPNGAGHTDWIQVDRNFSQTYSIAGDVFDEFQGDWAAFNQLTIPGNTRLKMADAGSFDFNGDTNPLTVAAGDIIEYLVDTWAPAPTDATVDAATLPVDGGTNTNASTLNAALTEHGDNIAAKANQTALDTLTGTVNTNQTNTTAAIAAVQTRLDNVEALGNFLGTVNTEVALLALEDIDGDATIETLDWAILSTDDGTRLAGIYVYETNGWPLTPAFQVAAAGVTIDDATPSTTTTYSSDRIETRLTEISVGGTQPANDIDQATLDKLYRAWHKAGTNTTATSYVNSGTLNVHSTLTDPTRTALQTAINNASSASTGGIPEVVEASGTLTLDATPIQMKDYVVLRAPAGETLTITTSETMDSMVAFSGGFFQNRTCTLTGQFNSYQATITDPDTQIEVGIWQLGTNSSNGPGGQIVEITAIDGSTVTLAEPLTQDFAGTVMKAMNNGLPDFLNRAGLEGDILLQPAHNVDNLIYLRAAYDCWISNGVRTDGTTDDGLDGTGAGELSSAIHLRQCYHVLIQNVTLDNARNHGDGGSGYGINVLSNSSMVLIDQCDIQRMRHSVLFHAGCAGNVAKDTATSNPIHPNFPNGGPTEYSFHGYASACLIVGATSGRIMVIDASQPGPNHCIAYSTTFSPITLSGTSSNNLVNVTLVNNTITGDRASLADRIMPAMFDQENTSNRMLNTVDGSNVVTHLTGPGPLTVGDTVGVTVSGARQVFDITAINGNDITLDGNVNGTAAGGNFALLERQLPDTTWEYVNKWSKVRPFWHDDFDPATVGVDTHGTPAPAGAYAKKTDVDPYAAANGLPAGYYLPDPSNVDLNTVTVIDDYTRAQFDPYDLRNIDTSTPTATTPKSVVVAASNAPQEIKDTATWVCDGTDDQIEIQTAIDLHAVAGGRVQLSGGTFFITDRILCKTGVTIAGESQFGTVIEPAADWALGGGAGVGGYCFEGTSDLSGSSIQNLRIHGRRGPDANPNRDIGGIRWEPSAVAAGYSPDNKNSMAYLFIEQTRRHPIYMGGTNAAGRGSQLSHIETFDCNEPIIAATNDTQWSHIHSGSSGGNGIEVTGGNQHFSSCKMWFADGHGWLISSQRNLFTACEAQDNELHGFEITAGKNTFANCSADSNSYRLESNPNKIYDGFHMAGGLGWIFLTGMAFDKRENRENGQTPTSHQRHAVSVGTNGDGAFPVHSVIDVMAWDHFAADPSGGGTVPATSRVDIRGT